MQNHILHTQNNSASIYHYSQSPTGNCSTAWRRTGPTGTISRIAGCSSGIEPIFSVTTKHRVLNNQEFIQLHPLIEKLGIKEGWLINNVRDLLAKGIPPR
ncbi:hypothetical protein KA005_56025 [bacterium]|nr:hypothetical protein [bacterium]